LEAYLWLIFVFKQLFFGEPKKIILVGDSAGGNLVAALTCLIIKLGIRKPDGIFMIYPAMNLDEKAFTPSLLYTLDDFILPHTYLKICAKAYVQKYKGKLDYLLSPIVTPLSVLKEFPLTHIYVGSRDPFSDDCYRFT
jgi:hormone-sensitive lipase